MYCLCYRLGSLFDTVPNFETTNRLTIIGFDICRDAPLILCVTLTLAAEASLTRSFFFKARSFVFVPDGLQI
jgi:hypothetical protein